MKIIPSITLASCLLVVIGCNSKPKQQEHTTGIWRAEHLSTLDGFEVPECAVPSPHTGLVHVSNIESEPDKYWEDDEAGFISTIAKDLRIAEPRAIESSADQVIHSPKGMCWFDGWLYFTDNTRVMRSAGGKVEIVADGFEKANDLATDGTRVWVSDTAAGRIFALTPEGERNEIKAPASINGITFDGERMYGVSWDLHEIYELDPEGEKEPVAFGLAEHFVNLDGIEVLADGSFVISDFKGNAVWLVGADRKTVHKLIDIPSPADIGIDRAQGLLYVPQFMENKVSIYRLSR